MDIASGAHRVYASGLRNPNGLAWEPKTGALWTTVNERDLLGDNLVPDYMTSVKDGGFYGWPYSYYGDHVDNRVQPQKPDMVAKAMPAARRAWVTPGRKARRRNVSAQWRNSVSADSNHSAADSL